MEPPSTRPLSLSRVIFCVAFLFFALPVLAFGLFNSDTEASSILHRPTAWLWMLLGILVGWLGSALFTILDHAVFSLAPEEIESLRQENSAAAKLLVQARRDVDHTWITLLAGGLFFNLVFGVFIGCAIFRWWNVSGVPILLLVFLFSAFLVFVLGEILPGLLAAKHVKSWSPTAVAICQYCRVLFAPLTFLPLQLLHLLSRALQLNTLDRARAVEVEKRLLALIGFGQVDVTLEEEEREMIDHALEFGESNALDIMTPRAKIAGIETHTPHEEVLKFLRESEYTRLIVYTKTLDHIEGVLHKRQALLYPRKDYHAHITPAVFVTEETELIELLAIMKKQRRQIVVVLDEFGATAGIVSMNDLLQALMGSSPEDGGEEVGQAK
ncbi:TPA: hypothetical protein DDW35_07070 [Candidatus Sumerlaeota bacterium]|jgi:putative hemolysin|nr:hypothetical protein [Candidatus Sumerlaeota bacterium]